MPPDLRPLVLPFAGVEPAFAAPPSLCGIGSSVLGRVTAGTGLVLGPFAVIRADGNTVEIGDDACLGEGATVHIARDLYPTVMGRGVAVGRNAVVHACRVGHGCTIEDDVVILDGSVVGDGVLIEAGATVYPRSALEAGGRYAGSPAVPVGRVDPAACRARGAAIRAAAEAAVARGGGAADLWGWDAHFVADTAVMAGAVELAAGASVFFGCRFDAGRITLGRDANVQDNSVIDAPSGLVAIGDETTVGHNVRMEACRVGSRSLVGIGAVLAAGTLVGDDVLLAAGAATTPGQALESGWLWGGRPARPLKRLDAARRAMMAATITQYVAYGAAFREAQERRRGASRTR